MVATQLTKEQTEIINKGISWDDTKSVTRACEELNELSLALLKYLRQDISANCACLSNVEHIKEKMADVYITLQHLELKFGTYQEYLDYKIDRLNTREGTIKNNTENIVATCFKIGDKVIIKNDYDAYIIKFLNNVHAWISPYPEEEPSQIWELNSVEIMPRYPIEIDINNLTLY
jgi:hypothetical protein